MAAAVFLHCDSVLHMQGWTGLMEAACHGHVNIAQLLIANRADVNVQCWKEVG